MTIGLILVAIVMLGAMIAVVEMVEDTALKVTVVLVMTLVVVGAGAWLYQRNQYSFAINIAAKASSYSHLLEERGLLVAWCSNTDDKEIMDRIRGVLHEHGSGEISMTSRSAGKTDWHRIWRCDLVINNIDDPAGLKTKIEMELATRKEKKFESVVIEGDNPIVDNARKTNDSQQVGAPDSAAPTALQNR
jgi:hypothetical protein